MSNNFWSEDYDCEISLMERSNKGGQHVGRTESGVRVRIFSKANPMRILIDVSVRHRSQHKSRHLAMTMAEYAYVDLGL